MTTTSDPSWRPAIGPRSSERPADAGFALVAGLEGIGPAKVDGGGIVTPWGADWSVDWWIGADDRWHLPAREPAVRQRRVGHGPIIETSLRVPSGDVIHTVYPVVVPGGMATVIEIANESPVPVALAIAMRPYSVDGFESSDAAIDTDAGGRRHFEFGSEEMVLASGRPALRLPRKPNEVGGSATVDLLDTVSNGETLTWSEAVEGPAANVVCLYPLPHRTSLRFVIPGPGVDDVALDGLPDAASAARGWTVVVDRASSYEFPDSGITDLAGAARARLLLESPSLVGDVVAGLPGAGAILEGLAIGGHRLECRQVLEAFADSFPTSVSSAVNGSELAAGLSAAAEMLGDAALNQRLLEPVAQLTHLVERSAKKNRRYPVQVAAAGPARQSLATLATLVGQTEAAADLRQTVTPTPAPDLATVTAMAEQAAPARRWSEGEHEPDSAVAAARFWLAARQLLVRPGDAVSPDGAEVPVVELLPDFPTAWRGGTVEIHRAPVAGANVSFAIRWHGYRPAILWEVEDGGPVELRCPGLDPDWATTEQKGEALLAGLAEELPPAPMPGDSFN